MRKTLLSLLSLLAGFAMFAQSTVYNQDNNYGFGKGFMTKDALEYIIHAITLPPSAPTPQDSIYYFKGREIRQNDKERYAAAASDAVWSINVLASFSEAVGIELSEKNTPELWKLVSEAAQDTDNLIVELKSRYYRMRPFVRWQEPDDGVADRERLKNTSSSPSGHSGLAGTIMALLLEVHPDRAAEIIRRGNDFIDSRWILGFHYISDCELGSRLGFYTVFILHSNRNFQKQMTKAKKEAQKISRHNAIKNR
ncbi:MAG: phosphatase PAP2 family protein [Candidatus Cryptobacteroides sp.]